MPSIERRHMLSLALAAIPAGALAQTLAPAPLPPPGLVPADADREGRGARSIGVSSTAYKVLTRDTGGAMFVMEQTNRKKGGPPRHLHHNEDELFFVLEGDYDVEVGGNRVSLHAGDCILGPRGIPHGWAYVGNSVGRLLISFAPAGKMEAFFAASEKLRGPGKYAAGTSYGDALMHAFGMEHIGPSLSV
jgi:quercetin dioxygenase-like cupin family protein